MTKRYCTDCGVAEGSFHMHNCRSQTEVGYAPAYAPRGTRKDDAELSKYTIYVAIPPEVVQYAPDIQRFVDAMVYKLGVHAKKGKWQGYDLNKALELLRGEEKELTEAVARGNMVEIMLEAADVANYALIASAIAMEKK